MAHNIEASGERAFLLKLKSACPEGRQVGRQA